MSDDRPRWSVAGTLCLALALGAAACSHAGFGSDVRLDISLRMASVRAPLSECYASALKDRRKLAGTMWVAFDIEPGTGRFGAVHVSRSEIRHPKLEECVVQKVAALTLDTPQRTVVSVEYPVSFHPSP